MSASLTNCTGVRFFCCVESEPSAPAFLAGLIEGWGVALPAFAMPLLQLQFSSCRVFEVALRDCDFSGLRDLP